MGKVIASITTSVDGYVTGPDDGPEFGLGRGGERLHYWVMGGPWTYEGEHAFAMSDADKAFYEPLVANLGGGIVGPRDVRRGGRVGRARTRSPARWSC